MGKIVVTIKSTNQVDLFAKTRYRARRTPRQVETEALVGTGATRLYLKPSVIKALGLKKVDEIESQTTNGLRRRGVYDPVRIDLMGCHGIFEVVDIDENVPNLLGHKSRWNILTWCQTPRTSNSVPIPLMATN
jgi:predicted aspartyl protease